MRCVSETPLAGSFKGYIFKVNVTRCSILLPYEIFLIQEIQKLNINTLTLYRSKVTWQCQNLQTDIWIHGQMGRHKTLSPDHLIQGIIMYNMKKKTI